MRAKDIVLQNTLKLGYITGLEGLFICQKTVKPLDVNIISRKYLINSKKCIDNLAYYMDNITNMMYKKDNASKLSGREMRVIMYTKIKRIIKSKSGQAMTEYGLIIALVAVVLIGVLIALREKIEALFTSIMNALTL